MNLMGTEPEAGKYRTEAHEPNPTQELQPKGH